jgi:alanyl-tRNA synthetase
LVAHREVKILLNGILYLAREQVAMHDRLAHTAEHAFIGSLQKLLGQTLSVRKVDHRSSGNTAFIVIPQLELDIVLRAEVEVNLLIAEGRKVIARNFSSLEEAKKSIPHLRANEERITGEVRVVEIENHDVAACAMDHASNLKECDFFLVTRLSKSGDEYEVDFVVGRQAKETAVVMSSRLLKVCGELGANINSVESTARKLKSENESNARKLRILGGEKLSGIRPETNGKIKLLKGVFENLADTQLQEFAGQKIADADTVVLVANVGSETASVVFARNEKMDIDCIRLFMQFAGQDGRGGGKSHFVTGVIKKEAVREVLDRIADEIMG